VKAMIAELEHAVAERVAALKKLDVKTASKEDIVSLKRATRLQQRLRFYHEVYQPNWLFKREAKRDKKWWAVEFEPIWSTKFGKMLWSHGDRCVFMSATPGSKEEFCLDRKSTRLNSSHVAISYAVFCLKKKKQTTTETALKI